MLPRSPFVVLLAVAAAAVACGTTGSTTSSPQVPATFGDQVARGADVYAAHCAKCHGDAGEGGDAPRLVGLAHGALPLDPPPSREHRRTRFVTAGDVASFVVSAMPPKNPGSLPTEDYLAVLAFALKANGIDHGREKLTLARAGTLEIPR